MTKSDIKKTEIKQTVKDGIMAGLDDAAAFLGGDRTRGAAVRIQAVPVRTVDISAIRRSTGLSQASFAATVGVSVATLRNWEQGHRTPSGPAQVLLNLLERNPRLVEETLGNGMDGSDAVAPKRRMER